MVEATAGVEEVLLPKVMAEEADPEAEPLYNE